MDEPKRTHSCSFEGHDNLVVFVYHVDHFKRRQSGVSRLEKLDLLVTIDIVVPQKLSKKEREAIEALAEVTDWSPRDAEES